ncbi:MAG: hypothetical protein DWQ19_11865 [Crenarchaeota archaeon]|nr:MAG: hypothetical protein DWQ19_11865 [Thermoproteota archaeon]
MATFNYTGSGGLELIGCAGPNNTAIFAYTAFTEGDAVYIRQNARKGQLEKVVIKKINFLSEVRYNYQDTFNRLWLELELCNLATAQNLINIYNAQSHAAYVLYLKNCNAELS